MIQRVVSVHKISKQYVSVVANSWTRSQIFRLEDKKKRKKKKKGTQTGLSMPAAAGVVGEKGSEHILAHTGTRELDGYPLGGGGSGFGLVPGYTTLSVRVRANT